MEADAISTGNGRGSAGETRQGKGRGKGRERTGTGKWDGGEGSDEDSWDFFGGRERRILAEMGGKTDCWNNELARAYTRKGREEKGGGSRTVKKLFFFLSLFFFFSFLFPLFPRDVKFFSWLLRELNSTRALPTFYFFFSFLFYLSSSRCSRLSLFFFFALLNNSLYGIGNSVCLLDNGRLSKRLQQNHIYKKKAITRNMCLGGY